ncbi:MAG: 7-cyano-7-deazaguanine synthase in queuosine biosynthesis [Roseivirga sp.]|jgi:7-cyano-7-deazaguanine synthase in queuosine biosynthesis
MTDFYFHHNPDELPDYSDECHPVQIFDSHPLNKYKCSHASKELVTKVRKLGVTVNPDALDLVTIATSVTSAETFEPRENAPNSWSRILNLNIPVLAPDKWIAVSKRLESLLGFLTGDQWKLSFSKSDLELPKPINSKQSKLTAESLKGLNSVCLFSGGLDSAIGAIDILNGNSDIRLMLVSHAYRADGAKQQDIKKLLNKPFGELSYSIAPQLTSQANRANDTSMRGRSFNFLAMAVLGITALRNVNDDDTISQIIVPENGYISINPPLTRRRIGSHSTRTTHPNFLSQLEFLLNDVGFNIHFVNPYQFKTKGEMLAECVDQNAVKKVIPLSVSCSHWHRNHIQCGYCLPCLIRRASVFHAGFKQDADYEVPRLKNILKEYEKRDDVHAVQTAILRLKKSPDFMAWLRQSGPLPLDIDTREKLESTVKRGLAEVEEFLKSVNLA